MINFDAFQTSKLKKIFHDLDHDGSGALAIDELYEPLLALGLVEQKSSVEDLVSLVDSDKSGKIEFDEFLKIINSSKDEKGRNQLTIFFKNLVNGKIYHDFKDLPFKLFISNRRRELMLQGYTGPTQGEREKGLKVIHAFSDVLKYGSTVPLDPPIKKPNPRAARNNLNRSRTVYKVKGLNRTVMFSDNPL